MEALPKNVQAHIATVVGPDEKIIDVHHPTHELARKKANMNYIALVNPAAWLVSPIIVYKAEFEFRTLGLTYYVVTDEALYTIVLDMDKRGKWIVTNGNNLSRVPYEHVVTATVDTPGQGCTCMQVPHAFVQTAGVASKYDENSDSHMIQPAGEWMLVQDPHAMVVQINDAMRAYKKREREIHANIHVASPGPAEKRVFVSSSRTPEDVRMITIQDGMDMHALRLAMSEAFDLSNECPFTVQLMYAQDRYSNVMRVEDIRDNDALYLAIH